MVADAGQKEIAKCYKFLVNVIKEKVEMVTPASLVRRFCAVLGLGAREMKAAEEMARAAVPSEGSTRSKPCLAHSCCLSSVWAISWRSWRWRARESFTCMSSS